MIRILRRAWRYFGAVVEGKLEQVADPRIQIEQAIEESKRQHALLTQQAAAVASASATLDRAEAFAAALTRDLARCAALALIQAQ